MRLNDIEKQDANYLFHNVLKQINGSVDRPYKIIGYGKYNIIICIDGSYYRIGYRGRSDDANNRWRYMHARDAATLFAVVHGYTDSGRYMRLVFNAYLYRKQRNLVNKMILNMDMYEFMMNRPFSLL